MMHVDVWNKAAECDRALAMVADPERRLVLNSLRSLWISLGDRPLLDKPERAAQLSAIVQIHAELMWSCRSAMH